MTEPAPVSSATHSVPIVDSLGVASVPATAAPPPKALPNGAPADEEEDYTIKCVCDFQDDDGNTVLCETCDTWQHIECYYPGTEGPGENDTHKCVECDPRPIDRKRATEVQRARRLEQLDPTDRRVKKPVPLPKSHKKKPKPEQVNGGTSEKGDAAIARNGTSPREPTAKRPKASHRTSNSTTHIVPLKQPASSRRSASASHALQSPSKNTQPLHSDLDYSDEFMHLYDNDPGETTMTQNLFGDLKTADKLSQWCRDPDAVRQDTGGKSHQEIFFRCDQPVDSMALPLVKKHTKVDESVESHGAHPKWVYLTVESETPRNAIVGELRGKIGHMHDYANDEDNRWDELRHPLPFVIFHPTLPIYIDTREQGTLCRYLRRSCQPTVHMKTFLENETDYRFCYVTNKDLPPGSELTIQWTSDQHVRKITRDMNLDDKIKQESPEDVEYIREYFLKVLADFGGCACNDPDGCVLRARVHRKPESKLTNGKSKRGRKTGTKVGQTNGRTTSSRSGSEALRYQEEDDNDDAQSTSASSRSKPQSRDLTPSYGATDIDTLGPDVDDRTKRKIAALEKHENDRNQPATKKKKRNSGGAAVGAMGPISATRATFPDGGMPKSIPNTPSINTKSRYVDASAGPKGSNSPVTPGGATAQPSKPGSTAASPITPSPRRSNYVDAATQVDLDADEAPAAKTPTRKPFKSLTKQLLQRCHNERLQQKKTLDERTSPFASALSAISPVTQKPMTTSPVPSHPEQPRDADGDVRMEGDGGSSDAAAHPPVEAPRPPGRVEPPQTTEAIADAPTAEPPKASTSTDEASKPLNGFRPTDMHVSMPPKLSFAPPAHPTVTIPNSTPTPGGMFSAAAHQTSASPVVQTPSSTIPPMPLLTPGGAHLQGPLVQPSPIKKKLSLGDYMSRRKTVGGKAEAEEKERADKDKAKGDTNATEAATSSPTVEAKALPAVAEEASPKDGDVAVKTEAEPDAAPLAEVAPDKGDAMDVDTRPLAAAAAEGKAVEEVGTAT